MSDVRQWYTPKHVVISEEGNKVTFRTAEGAWIGDIDWSNVEPKPDEYERMNKVLDIAFWLDAAFAVVDPPFPKVTTQS